MKSHDEIKKGLECCAMSSYRCEDDCPYREQCRYEQGGKAMNEDALALIQQLEAENSRYHQETTEMYAEMCMLREKVHRLEAERDAMKEALGLMVYQYCVSGTELDHRYMCAGETAFRVLGLEQYGDTRTLESWLFPECQDKEE